VADASYPLERRARASPGDDAESANAALRRKLAIVALPYSMLALPGLVVALINCRLPVAFALSVLAVAVTGVGRYSG